MAADGGTPGAGGGAAAAGAAGRSERIGEVLAVLAGAGVELDRHALLDALWLAGRLPTGRDTAPLARALGIAAAPSPVTGAAPPPPPPPPDAADRAAAGPSEVLPLDDLGGDLHAAPVPATARRTARVRFPPPPRSSAAIPLRVPENKALLGELGIGRALRPLRQRRATTRVQEFDEAATAAALAESGLPDVVLRPGQERWLDLALVVDDGMSMLLWRRLAVEWRIMMQRIGAFRMVRVHGLDTRSPEAPLLRGRPFDPDTTSLPPTVLADASGQTLILLLSDGMGAAWRDGRIHRLLRRWAATGPVAVLHALPPRLWGGSGIQADRWRVTTRRRGAAGGSWRVSDPVLPAELAPFDGLPVPVLETSAGPVAAWSRLLASAGGTVDLPLLHGPAGRTVVPPVGEGADGVRRFREAASPEAYRLAAHIAAVAPVSVPVMRLVQTAVPWAADTAHLAEVFLGGLMQPVAAPVAGPLRDQHRIFDFPEAVKSALLDAVSTPELLRTGRHIGQRLEQLAGRSPDFPAWLAHPDGMDRLPAGSRAFSAVERRLMSRLGASPQVVPADEEEAEADAESADPDGWRPLTARDPRRLGPYTLHGRQPGPRSVVYLGRDRDGGEAAVRVIRPGIPAEEAQALLGTEVTALTRMAGQYAPQLLGAELHPEQRAEAYREPPWLAMTLYRPSGGSEAGPPPQLSSLLRPDYGSRMRRDILLSIAYGWHLASAVSLCHLKGMVLPELTPHSVRVVGRSLMLTGLGRCVVDGASRARGAEAVPTMADNVLSLGQILRRLGDKHRATWAPESGDMALWQGDTWRPLREIVLACVAEEAGARPTASQVAECFARYVPLATELRDDGPGASGGRRAASDVRAGGPLSFAAGPRIPLDDAAAERSARELSARPSGSRARFSLRGDGGASARKRELLRARLDFSYRATVIGTDSGVGRSTVTVALGAVLAAARGGGVIALDAGRKVGELAGRLHLGGRDGVRQDLMRALPTISSYRDVLGHTVAGPSGLRALAHTAGRATPAPRYDEEYRRMMELLGRHFSVVLADWAYLRTKDVTDVTLAMTDRLIVVTRMTEEGIAHTEHLLARLTRRGYGALAERAALVVTALVGPGRALRRDDIAARLRDHRGGLVFLPYDHRLDSMREIALNRLRFRTHEAFVDLATLLAEDFPRRGGGSPAE
ncbi:SAV_2336 N-terminal domain-related protein [Streptomyces sp. YGL11-2]|uniref:SAV_2336 N-terminal domain-related protein n=1 Tax=Streptomyces sp. YGL11-2 TaxID=3414028 RepID=UPI003CF50E3F